MASKLFQLRNGVPSHKTVDIRGQRFTVVMVSADVIRECEEATQEYVNSSNGKASDRSRDLYYDTMLAYHCLRDSDDPALQRKAADSPDEIREILDTEDITRITAAYSELVINKAPKIELMTDEQLTEIKNYLEATPLSDLSTVSLVHLGNFHQSIASER